MQRVLAAGYIANGDVHFWFASHGSWFTVHSVISDGFSIDFIEYRYKVSDLNFQLMNASNIHCVIFNHISLINLLFGSMEHPMAGIIGSEA